jgi:DNA helicase-2/ATP-dependent DNA helicase PcrA
LVVAGAGTGKTSVLTRRISYLIESGLAQPEQILALTFTDKAAQEMQERVDILLPLGQSMCNLMTFNAFGNAILKEFALELGLEPKFRVLSTAEQVIFLRRRLFDLPLRRYRPLGSPISCLRDLTRHISRLKDEVITPEVYLGWAEKITKVAQDSQRPDWIDRADSQRELAACYAAYQKLCAKDACMDYGDQIFLCLELLRSRPHVLERLRARYRYVLVDEFQDTNLAQFELVSLLVEHHRQLTVVGDDDQSIYAFRGAAISNILGFQERFPDATHIVLTENYRSRQEILDAAYRLICVNNPYRLEYRNQIDKKLRAANPDALEPESPESLAPFDEVVEYHQFESLSGEADAVAERVAELVSSGFCAYNDIALLMRGNRDADPYLRALNSAEIPYRFSGNDGLYLRMEVKLLLSYLRFLNNPKDSVSLFFVISSALYAFPLRELMALSGVANSRHEDLLDVLQRHAKETLSTEPPEITLTAQGQEVLERFLNDYHTYCSEIPVLNTGQILYRFCNETGWLKLLMSGELGDSSAMVQNTSKFFDIIARIQEVEEGILLPQLVEQLDLLIESGDSPGVVEADPNVLAVQVLTVHSSKGLEFPVVFVVGMNEKKFPGRKRADSLEFPVALSPRLKQDDNDEMTEDLAYLHEERRLFYVAVTRAKKRLWISNALETGYKSASKRSRFVEECLGRRLHRSQTRPDLRVEEKLHRQAPIAASLAYEPGPFPEHRVVDLSFGRIRDYLDCPLKFNYAHIMKVPVPPNGAASYGKAIHTAIYQLLLHRIEERPVTLEDVHQFFHQAWEPVGFLNRQHAEARYQSGLHALDRFYRDELVCPVPIAAEQSFSVRLASGDQGGVRVKGRIDRIDRQADGRLSLTDFKTAAIDDIDKANQEANESLQLHLYALAYQAEHRCLPDELRLHFVDSGIIGRCNVNQSHLERAANEIEKVNQGIRQRDYAAKPRFGACRTCAFKPICPHAQ